MRRAIILAAVLTAGAVRAFDASPLLQYVTAQTWTPASLNPVAWWKGDGNTLDSAGSYNASWTGTVAYASGVNAQAFALNGTNAIYASSPVLITSNAFTVCAWVNVSRTNNYGRVIDISDGVNSAQIINDGGGAGAAFQWITKHTQYETALNSLKWGVSPALGSWTHLVYSVTANGTSTFYVNGSAKTSASSGNAGASAANSMIRIGSRRDANSVTFLPANIDDVLIFNRALTQSEITQLYNWRQ
jgi:hypothetical protein